MARPTKQGIDYFPYDIDADKDDKLGMIIGEFGEKGERLWWKLLAYVYKNYGYYAEWDEDAQLRFLGRYNYCGFSMSFINEVVPRFVRWGLLDKSVFDTFHILTSRRIQKTWLEASRKRKDRVINEKIWLLEVNGASQAEETRKKAEETTQSKVKKSKENNNSNNPPPFTGSILKNIDDLKADCLKDRINFVEHVCRQSKKKPESIPDYLEKFNSHLRSLGELIKNVKEYRLHFQNWLKKQNVDNDTQIGSQVKIKVK